MYRLHFGLAEKPFQIAPSPKYLFPSETHDESRARVLYGIQDRRGFTVVYGAVGLGKTTVLLSVLEDLDPRVRVAFLFHPMESLRDLLRMVAHEFGFPHEGMDEVELLQELNAFLIERLAQDEVCVLIVDEAQNLPLDLLEKLRTLSNLQTQDASLLQIVLVGQPELHDKLMDPRLLQLRQRVSVWHRIEPLNAEETQDYILHRLQRAGARRPKEILSPATCNRVHHHSGGVPRVVNQICDTALMVAYGRNAPRVEPAHVDEAARELQLDTAVAAEAFDRAPRRSEPAPRPRFRWRPAAAVAVVAVLALLAILYGVGRDAFPGFAAPPGPTGSPASPSVEPREEPVGPSPSSASQDPTGTAAAAPEAAPDPTPTSESKGALESVLQEHAREVARWRQEGRRIFTVHLHSLKERARAEAYARDLALDPAWEQPVFVERSGGDPIWYRVMVGGFSSGREARAFIDRLKRERGVRYAQLMTLDPDADILLPQAVAAKDAVQGEQG